MAHISVPVSGDPYTPHTVRDDVQPATTGPGVAGSGVTGPGVTGQGVTGQGVTGPGVTGPGVTGQGVTDPGVASTNVGPGVGVPTESHTKFTEPDRPTAAPIENQGVRRGSRFANLGNKMRGPRPSTDTRDGTVVGSRRSSGVAGAYDIGARRGSTAVQRASIGDPALFHAASRESGWRGLFANKRSLGVALFASLGGFLYGYNQGVFGQVQVMSEFYERYKSTLNIEFAPAKKGMLTAILELGAMVGAIMAGPIADRWSRKLSISGWVVVFIMGTIIQTAANWDVACIYAGRWFAGMAVGALSMLVPMYNAEVASPGIRGALVALQQLAITFGILVSYWIAYGTNYIGGTSYDPVTGTGQSSAAWRIPLGLQIVPAIVLGIGAVFLPYSPRWLMIKGREEECLNTLCRLRHGKPEDPAINFEFKSLQAERLAEKRAAQERYGVTSPTWRTSMAEYRRLLTTKPLLHRLLIGAGAQMLQQWTGINAVIYYAPTIFQQLGLTGNTSSLLATGVVGIVNFVFTIPAVLWVDQVGRRPGMIAGSFNMAVAHATIGAIIAVYGDRFSTHKEAGNGAIFMVYWFIVWFAMTWGPMAWIVSAEVWPLQYRSRGMSLSSATNWLMNFTVAEVTPVAISNIGWKTYMIFMVFCIVGMLWAIFLLPELKGLSLEQVDEIFGDSSGAEDIARREKIAREIGLDKAEETLGLHHEKDQYRHSSDIEATPHLSGRPTGDTFDTVRTDATTGPGLTKDSGLAKEPGLVHDQRV